MRRFLPSLLLVLISLAALGTSSRASQTDIVGPPGSSNNFGFSTTVLPNGNIVVTDAGYSVPGGAATVGAVYLYDGNTLNIISTLTGSSANDSVGIGGVVVLSNGNYVVISQFWNGGNANGMGAVTFCNAATGLNGTVSPSNSLVGSNAGDFVGQNSEDWIGRSGVIPLTNGNYVVQSSYWDNGGATDAGAVTFGSGVSGVAGAVSAANSLVGSTASDGIGATLAASNAVVPLSAGNYVVASPTWDNGGAVDAGAVTFGNGTTGVAGVISASNSLVGTTTNEGVGWSVVSLTNGNYVIADGGWDSGSAVDAGAVTFGNGKTGVKGIVTSSNSLVGSSAGDGVGSVTALTNGNYVVASPSWDNGSTVNVGAVTFANGATGTTGPVSISNSLVGSASDVERPGVGPSHIQVYALSNGNYVVCRPRWDDGAILDVGAVTFGNGVTGITGVVSSSNSLIGSNQDDNVGDWITPLTNGNYVVNSNNWHNAGVEQAGAATFGNGVTGVTGTVTSSNSLVGTHPQDFVGNTAALSNGNYVVSSSLWDNGALHDVGAATFGNGTTGVTGEISSSNSLIGSNPFDGVNVFLVLTNGNYVIWSPGWNSATVADVGAITLGNGTTGTSGVVSASNSLVGSMTGDLDNALELNHGVALANGNFVIACPLWNNGSIVDAGAVIFGDGTTPTIGTISASNSLVGSKTNDRLGVDTDRLVPLSNGNYMIYSRIWDNGAIANAGAVTFGNGVTGSVGPITSAATGGNSVVGTVTSGIMPFKELKPFAFDATRNRVLVPRSATQTVSVIYFNTTAIADGAIDDPAIYDNGAPDALKTAIIPNGRTISLTGRSHIGQVQLDCTAALTSASASNYVIGSVRKTFCSAANESFVYPIGDAANYSPLSVANVTGSGHLTASTEDSFLQGLQYTDAVSRFWNLEGKGVTADLTFHYVDSDVNGNEQGYKAFRRSAPMVNIGTITDPLIMEFNRINSRAASAANPTLNSVTVLHVSSFSDWGIGNPPIGSGRSIFGR